MLLAKTKDHADKFSLKINNTINLSLDILDARGNSMTFKDVRQKNPSTKNSRSNLIL